jgi:hypothetical protein
MTPSMRLDEEMAKGGGIERRVDGAPGAAARVEAR